MFVFNFQIINKFLTYVKKNVFLHLISNQKTKSIIIFIDWRWNRFDGDLLAVFHREGFGDIDLVWGNDNGGLKHILQKHIGNEKSFVNVEEAACQIKEIIETGITAFENIDKAVFQIGNKIVTVRKNFREKGKKIADKNWVLTAYDEKTADGGSAITTSN